LSVVPAFSIAKVPLRAVLSDKKYLPLRTPPGVIPPLLSERLTPVLPNPPVSPKSTVTSPLPDLYS